MGSRTRLFSVPCDAVAGRYADVTMGTANIVYVLRGVKVQPICRICAVLRSTVLRRALTSNWQDSRYCL